MTDLRRLLLKAFGEASSLRMLEGDPVDLEAELRAAKETGVQLEETLKQALALCKGDGNGKS